MVDAELLGVVRASSVIRAPESIRAISSDEDDAVSLNDMVDAASFRLLRGLRR